jgi:cupin superfamily acireductone dioxygenase involved in methionine salvage
MKYGVKIPDWTEGLPMTIIVEAENESDAYQKTVDWINKYAGYHYCDKLPIDTTVKIKDD